MVHGYSLPNEYFSKGNNSNEKFKESCIDPSLAHERDIKEVFKKIKQFCNDENAKDLPKDNSLLKERDAFKSTPTHVMAETVDVITKELCELSDRSTSENCSNDNCNFLQRVSHFPQTLNKYLNPTQNTFHIADVKHSSKISYNSPLTSSQTFSNRFHFSRLDDGPKGKGSIVELDPSEKNVKSDLFF